MNKKDFVSSLKEVKEKFCTVARKKDSYCPCSCCPVCIEERGFGEVDWNCPFRAVEEAITSEEYNGILNNN